MKNNILGFIKRKDVLFGLICVIKIYVFIVVIDILYFFYDYM